VEIKTETDSTDITECSRSNQPITGCVMHILYNHLTLCDLFAVCIFPSSVQHVLQKEETVARFLANNVSRMYFAKINAFLSS